MPSFTNIPSFLTKHPRVLAALGGTLWVTFHLYYIYSGISYLEIGASILVAGLGVLFMMLAVYSMIAGPHLGAAGKTGAWVLLVGMGLVTLGIFMTGLNIWSGPWFLAIGGEGLSAIGLVAFGLGALADGPQVLWKWLLLFLAPVYFLSFSTTSASYPTWAPEYTPEWFAVAYGLGWALLGLLLPRSRSATK